MAYCHDSVGVGHLRRTMAVCEHIGRRFPGSSFLLATGTPYIPLFERIPRVDYVKLPALTKSSDGTYGSKILNISLRRLIQCRQSLLQNAAEYYAPDVLLIDKAPLGVCRELIPTLQWLREHRPDTRVVFGMRDIEDEPEATIRQWARDGVVPALEAYFDEIWVYGMAEVFDPVVEYRLPDSLREKTVFTGYVSRGPCNHTPAPSSKPHVLVTVGGGTDGRALLEAYLAESAARLDAAGVRSVLIGGPDLPEAEASRLRTIAARTAGVEWVDFESCMSCRIAQAELIVTMGGYNTLCEIAARGKPALVVPRVTPRLEQAMRARLWAEMGGVHVLEPSELTPRSLADRVANLLDAGPAPRRADLDMNGLRRIAERFDAFWTQDASHASAVRV